MRKSTSMLSSWLTLIAAVVLVSGTSASADTGKITANPANGKIIFNEGKGDVPACMSCHGENALGNDDMGSPRLANIGYVYLVKQLSDFAADRRVPSGMGMVMNGFAKELSEQDHRDVAAFVDSLPRKFEPSDLKVLKEDGHEVGKTYLGKLLAHSGVEGKVASCYSCHGFNGRGADPMFPAIGNQKYVYLVNQLKSWRDGTRSNDPVVGGVNMMQAVAKTLTDDDIYNVAAYLSSAPPVNVRDGVLIDNQTVLKEIVVR
ncbi:c-type cytochrome [Candidatus Nitrotoga sp. M5]|uniref:c-type cytochrome n=1 Tax=Candidatus Nitrotoga sp. M5 TaxID=2890409 RepID=UPI001EF3C3A7|nr:c-type cytochrome [Candidatus Nitrotoga sp. M5]CAH1385782.1 Cytochrome c553 [Candidatus Nitrotoga sp. M5]